MTCHIPIDSELAEHRERVTYSYPENNCRIDGRVVNPQDVFANYLTHNSALGLVAPYIQGTQTVLAAGKPIMMMEFGTASCGGFPGLSDSFGAALW